MSRDFRPQFALAFSMVVVNSPAVAGAQSNFTASATAQESAFLPGDQDSHSNKGPSGASAMASVNQTNPNSGVVNSADATVNGTQNTVSLGADASGENASGVATASWTDTIVLTSPTLPIGTPVMLQFSVATSGSASADATDGVGDSGEPPTGSGGLTVTGQASDATLHRSVNPGVSPPSASASVGPGEIGSASDGPVDLTTTGGGTLNTQIGDTIAVNMTDTATASATTLGIDVSADGSVGGSVLLGIMPLTPNVFVSSSSGNFNTPAPPALFVVFAGLAPLAARARKRP